MSSQDEVFEEGKMGSGAVGLVGNILHFEDGGTMDLGDIYDDLHWHVNNPVIVKIINALGRERRIFRQTTKELLRRVGPRLTESNEFNRQMGSLAHKVGVPSHELRSALEPVLRELFDEMLTKNQSKKRVRQHRR